MNNKEIRKNLQAACIYQTFIMDSARKADSERVRASLLAHVHQIQDTIDLFNLALKDKVAQEQTCVK